MIMETKLEQLDRINNQYIKDLVELGLSTAEFVGNLEVLKHLSISNAYKIATF